MLTPLKIALITIIEQMAMDKFDGQLANNYTLFGLTFYLIFVELISLNGIILVSIGPDNL